MDLSTARFLASSAGLDALATVPGDVGAMAVPRLVEWFRKRHPPEQAAALSHQVELRRKAGDRVPPDGAWLLTQSGLEMMSHPAVAERRALRALELGLPIVDLTAGLGGDLRHFAEGRVPAFGLERDPATALLSTVNVPNASIVVGEAMRRPFCIRDAFVFLDPSRRAGIRRTFDPGAFSPSWDSALDVASSAVASCVKGPPGIPHEALPPGAELEVVQLGRSLRETTVWLGSGATAGLRRATWLPSGETLDSTMPECPPEPIALGRYLLDPQSCVTRAGLVRHLGARAGARLVDTHLAYLTADEPADDPLAEVFEVVDASPFGARRAKELFRARHWKVGDVRKRAFPVEPEEFRAMLGRLEGEPMTLFLTTIAGKRLIIVGRKVS